MRAAPLAVFCVVVAAVSVFALSMSTTNAGGVPCAGWPRCPTASAPSVVLGISSSERSKAQSFLESCESRPRYTYFTSGNSLKKQNNSFCGSANASTWDAIHTCDWAPYAESVMLVPATCFLAAAVLLVAGVAVWGMRPWIGGCRPSKGLFCPKHALWDPFEDGYSHKQVRALLIAAGICTAATLPFLVLGMMGNSSCTSAVSNAVSLVMGTADHLVVALRVVKQELVSLEEEGIDVGQDNIMPALNTSMSYTNRYYKQAVNYEGKITSYNKLHEGLMYATLLLPSALAVLVVVAGKTKVAQLAWPVAILGLIVGGLNFVAMGVHYAAATGLADTCVWVGKSLSADKYVAGDSVMDQFLSCDNTSAIQKLKLEVETAVENAYSDICSTYSSLCDQTVTCDANEDGTVYLNESCLMVNCSQDPSTCSKSTFEKYWTGIYVHDLSYGCADITSTSSATFPNGSCPYNETTYGSCNTSDLRIEAPCNGKTAPWVSIETCAKSCKISQIRGNASNIYSYEKKLEIFSEILTIHIDTLVNCESMRSLASEAKDSICITGLNSLLPLTYTEGVLGCLMIAETVIAYFATKRFAKQNQKEFADTNPDMTEMSTMDSDDKEAAMVLDGKEEEGTVVQPPVPSSSPAQHNAPAPSRLSHSPVHQEPNNGLTTSDMVTIGAPAWTMPEEQQPQYQPPPDGMAYEQGGLQNSVPQWQPPAEDAPQYNAPVEVQAPPFLQGHVLIHSPHQQHERPPPSSDSDGFTPLV